MSSASSAEALGLLERFWGYTSLRPLQEEAIDAVLGGRDSLVVLPTGGGKSLCYQLPALLRPGLAVVVSPLISLMKDQVDTLVGNGIAAACYNSAMGEDERASVVAGLREQRYRLLYVSPERLVGTGGERFLAMLQSARVRFLAVDEAHCISQWGHDFRPEYRQLGRARDAFPGASLHAFTATATGRVRRDIIEQLGLRDAVELVGPFDRANLTYRVLPRAGFRRQVDELLARHRGEAGIIYCTSRKEVDGLAASLHDAGHRVRPYHAGLSDDARNRNQDAFLDEDVDLVVATVAFGMGIDRSDVRFVLHAGAPRSLEHYQQESGRAGRDGLEAECVLVYSGADFLRWRMMLENAGEFTDASRTSLRDMERYASGVTCRHRHLVQYFGETYTKERCGACDVCLGELEPVPDAVTVARKVLSCVARVDQRFGASHVAAVLRGKPSEQLSARGHDLLSTFGLLKDASIAEVRGYIEQISVQGYLRPTDDVYPVLRLTQSGLDLLRNPGAGDVQLVRPRQAPKGGGSRRGAERERDGETWQGVDRDLFDRLRALRHEIARARHVPPYVIFHDTTLREMARQRPSSLSDLRHIYGVGERKALELGSQFLAVIQGQE